MQRIFSIDDQKLDAPDQGTDAWKALLKGRITGSKPSSLFFEFKRPDDWDAILDKWRGDTIEDFDEVALSRMAWGTKHEDTAVQVIVDHIPNSVFFDCPLIPFHDVYAASPDGALMVFDEHQQVEWIANIEIKCPGGGVGKTHEQMKAMVEKKWKTPAYYYMIQIHMEMVAQKTLETLFVVWTPLLTRMWKIPFDQDYWDLCLDVLETFRHKSVSFDVMKERVDYLKRRSWGVAKQPIYKEIHHTHNENM